MDRPGDKAAASLSDDELVTALDRGDDDATDCLVRQNIGWMLASARRILRDPFLAEDCVQAAFISIFKNVSQFRGQSSLRSWMQRIVVNQALMTLRTRNRLQETPIDPLMPVFDNNGCRLEAPWTTLETPETQLIKADTADTVIAGIDRLPEIYRIVLLLRDIEGLSTAEVADILDLSESNVKVRLHRARSGLKKLLEPLLRNQTL